MLRRRMPAMEPTQLPLPDKATRASSAASRLRRHLSSDCGPRVSSVADVPGPQSEALRTASSFADAQAALLAPTAVRAAAPLSHPTIPRRRPQSRGGVERELTSAGATPTSTHSPHASRRCVVQKRSADVRRVRERGRGSAPRSSHPLRRRVSTRTNRVFESPSGFRTPSQESWERHRKPRTRALFAACSIHRRAETPRRRARAVPARVRRPPRSRARYRAAALKQNRQSHRS